MFMQCPSRYLKQPSPRPVVPIKMAIIGPPKSGKTGRKYNFLKLSSNKAVLFYKLSCCYSKDSYVADNKVIFLSL